MHIIFGNALVKAVKPIDELNQTPTPILLTK